MCEPFTHGGSSKLSDLLEVVENHQRRPARRDRVTDLRDRVATERHVKSLGNRMHDAVETACLRQIAEPDTTREIAERAPTETRDEARFAHPTDAEHRHKPRTRVESLGQLSQWFAATDEAVAFGRQTVAYLADGQPDILFLHHSVGFVSVRWRREQPIARHLEQFDRLNNALQPPVAVRAHLQDVIVR